MIQREGRPESSKDCGAPANQSILHRSLGLIWEMAGRSQCNKGISLGDLLDFAVLKDPCQNLEACEDDPDTLNVDESAVCACTTNAQCQALGVDYACDTTVGQCIAKSSTETCNVLKQKQRDDRTKKIADAEEQVYQDYACPRPGEVGYDVNAVCMTMKDAAKYTAAFVDLDGPNTGTPSMLPECHLINLPDVGRSFGRALSHEFRIEIPNPWMERYLTDVAEAAMTDRPLCTDVPDFRITDPKVRPLCITRSAQLSREVYTDMSDDVDTLGELIEFLMDDSRCSPTSRTARRCVLKWPRSPACCSHRPAAAAS